MDHLLLATLRTDSNADEYNKFLPWAYDPFQILNGTKHIFIVDEVGSPNNISIDRITSVTNWTNNVRGSEA